MDQDAFHQMWGTAGAAPPVADDDSGTRSLDPKAFEKAWLTAAPQPSNKEDTDTKTSLANAALGGAIEGVPIVGPAIKAGTEKASAKIRSWMYGTPYEDELRAVQNYTKQSAEAHPLANTGGQVGGTIGSMLVPASLAPKAFGLAGPLLQRSLVGAGTNGLINAADTAARGGSAGDIATSGTVGGAIAGGLPVVGKGLGIAGNALLGPADTATNALLAKADALGIPIRFSQTTSSPFLAKVSQMAGKLPGSGMADLHGEQVGAVNRAVSNSFGEDTPELTRKTMQDAYKRIGGVMNTVEGRTNIPIDHDLMTDLGKVASQVKSVYTEDSPQYKTIVGHINDVLSRAAQHGDTLPGPVYKSLVQNGSDLDTLINSKEPIARFGGQIKESLRDALQRYATPEDAKAYQQARFQYKNAKTVEPLVISGKPGEISALNLQNKVAKKFGVNDAGPLGDIADVAQRFMRQPPDSGTPLGHAALNLLLGAGGAGAAGYASGYDPIEMLKGAALLPATALAARGATTLLNRPEAVNRLIQRLPAAVPAYNQLNAPQR